MDGFSETATTRSRLLGVVDREPLVSTSICSDDVKQELPLYLQRLFSDNVYLTDPWHYDDFLESARRDDFVPTWRLKERMKTAGVALVCCLNLGTDPPDVVKPAPCARRECWLDPSVHSKQKSLECIGHALQQQYEKWQSKAKYKQCLDPTSEDLRRVCINLRNAARNDRLLLHYNGHGVPRPTRNGELWVLSKHYTHYMPVAIFELRAWLGDPAIYVLDCSGAGALLPHFIEPNKLETSVEQSKKLFKDSGGGDLSVSADMASTGFYFNEGAADGFSPSRGLQTVLAQASQMDQARSVKNKKFSEFYSAMEGSCIVLAACRSNEILPLSPLYPADIFTSCLTTPLPIFLRWFILQNPFSMGDVNPDLSENIPGKDNDRKTPRGELNWIFTAITDTIAWTTLPSATFQKMFRQDLLVASLFRNFLLAKRIMKSLNCTPQSWPPLPDSSTHPLWQAWDLAAEGCLSHVVYMQRGSMMVEPKNNMPFYCTCVLCAQGGQQNTHAIATQVGSQSTFFADHLTAFEVWLDFGRLSSTEQPSHLPILLQVLLSQTHRLRALKLLRRYLLLGKSAVNLALLVGIFPYTLKLLQSPAADIRQVLVNIWASIIGFDPSCRQELVRDKSQSYFIQFLLAPDALPLQRVTAAFVLAEICNDFRDGQQTCLQQGLHRSCTSLLNQKEGQSTPTLKRWLCLCLFKLCEDSAWAKYVCLTEAGHTQLYALLDDSDPTVRAAAVLALGEMFGACDTTDLQGGSKQGSSSSESERLIIAELELSLQLLENCTDGSVIVRREALIGLRKFLALPAHNSIVQLIARELWQQSSSPCPWIITPEMSQKIVEMVKTVLEEWSSLSSLKATGDGRYTRVISKESSRRSNTSRSIIGLSDPMSEDSLPSDPGGVSPSTSISEKGGDGSSPNTSLHLFMATGYLRLWLALYEVQCKDPFPVISIAAQTIITWMRGLVSLNTDLLAKARDKNSTDGKMSPDSDPISSSMFAPHGSLEGTGGSFRPDGPYDFSQQKLSPVPRVGSRGGSPRTQLVPGGYAPSPSAAQFGTNRASFFGSQGNIVSGFSASNFNSSRSFDGGQYSETGLDIARPDLDPLSEQYVLSSPYLQSHLYDWLRALFLTPESGVNLYEDPLSVEGGNRLYRQQRLEDIAALERNVKALFKDLHEEEPLEGYDRDKEREREREREMRQQQKGPRPEPAFISSAATLSPMASKFEQRSILNIENADMTSLVMFHSFLDILAVSDGYNVGVWSISSGTKILNVSPNAHSQSMQPISPQMSPSTAPIPTPTSAQPFLFSFSPTQSSSLSGQLPGGPSGPSASSSTRERSNSSTNSSARITTMSWINETYDALLMLGSDNGTVSVWRDTAVSEQISMRSSRSPVPTPTPTLESGISLATSFLALPDVADTSRGSGLILSWQQNFGTLTVGGNSSTIRVWDLGREQCVRIFSTGLETCATALASRSVTHDGGVGAGHLNSMHGQASGSYGAGENTPLSWTFAGFADGSVSVFDERLPGEHSRIFNTCLTLVHFLTFLSCIF